RLTGDDELATLDSAMHQLANELVNLRKQDRALIDNTAEIIFSLNNSLHIVQVNDAIVKRFGYERDDVVGKLFSAYLPEAERPEVYKKLSDAMSTRSETVFECSLEDSFKVRHTLEVTAQWSEADAGLFCVARDITLRKEAENLKQDVLAMVSHDLRAPL